MIREPRLTARIAPTSLGRLAAITATTPAEAEGFVYVHPGIHGGDGSDLDAAARDWRNPVARLSIKTWKVSR